MKSKLFVLTRILNNKACLKALFSVVWLPALLSANAGESAISPQLTQYLSEQIETEQFASVEDFLSQHSPELQEQLVYSSLALLNEQQHVPSRKSKDWLMGLAAQQPKVRSVNVMDGFEVVKPKFDYPAQARKLLYNRRSAQRAQDYQHRLLEGNFNWGSVFNPNNPELFAQQSDLILALRELPAQQLVTTWYGLDDNLYFPDNQVATAFAKQINSPSLHVQILALPIDQNSIDLLEWLRTTQEPDSALSILESGLKNRELRYYTYWHIGALGASYPPAAKFLLDKYRNSSDSELVGIVMQELQSL
ncbi:hypothetical protein DBZ36_00205 [Alginatibacterium sediminis]|uniref:HEAT repeat domain-containing protein n=1 Tax=Alginatibacterium sediminis TaxID=2164068 RepID=A0A420EN00_9ALTE|nr:hypothetical protein [Alginatibacterium sediminis]RKF22105.1 hypothetical protein DBZ36_00205 [Alginatibacterium sediminis]